MIGIDKKQALKFANLSKIAYLNELEIVDRLSPAYNQVKIFDCGTTQGIGLVNDSKVIIVFRGTKVEIRKCKPETWWQKILHWVSGSSKTVDFGDIKTDLQFKKEDFYNMGLVHRGFKKAFNEAIDEILAFIHQNHKDGRKLYICGHSLGGALSVLLGAYLRKVKIDFHSVWTYGQPRVFSHEASGYQCALWDQKLNRFINSIDIVPRVPLYLQGFSHFGRVMFFDRSGKFHEDISFLMRAWIVIRDLFTLRIVINSVTSLLGAIRKIGKESLADHDIKKYVQLLEDAILEDAQ